MAETVPPSIALLVTLKRGVALSERALPGGDRSGQRDRAVSHAGHQVAPAANGVHANPGFGDVTVAKAAVDAVPALLMPVILGRGILSGLATPTEMSSIAVLYGLLLAGPFYRRLSLRTLWVLLVETASLTGMVLLVIAAATAFARFWLNVRNVHRRRVRAPWGRHDRVSRRFDGDARRARADPGRDPGDSQSLRP